jgi:hypothetical protein
MLNLVLVEKDMTSIFSFVGVENSSNSQGLMFCGKQMEKFIPKRFEAVKHLFIRRSMTTIYHPVIEGLRRDILLPVGTQKRVLKRYFKMAAQECGVHCFTTLS